MQQKSDYTCVVLLYFLLDCVVPCAAHVHVEQVNERDTAVLGILGPNEIFGEISFVQVNCCDVCFLYHLLIVVLWQGGETTASVIANSAVDLYVIEGYSIFRLMKVLKV